MSFAWDNNKTRCEKISGHGNFQEGQDFNSCCEKEEGSYDPFGIYETLEKMKEDELNGNVNQLVANEGDTHQNISIHANNQDEGILGILQYQSLSKIFCHLFLFLIVSILDQVDNCSPTHVADSDILEKVQ